MIKENLISKLKSFFSTLKKSDRYKYIGSYTEFLTYLDTYIENFRDTEISIDFPTISMLHMNIPRYLYKKYGKGSFVKNTGTNGYILKYTPKNLSFIITYTNDGRVDDNVTVKIGNILTDYVIDVVKSIKL